MDFLLWIFGWGLLVLVVWLVRTWRKQRRLEMIHAERMAALERGVPLPELPDYGESPRPHSDGNVNPRWPLGVGAVFIMLGIGFCLALRLSGDHYHQQIWPIGLIGVFLGVGLMLHYFLMRPPAK